MKNITIKYGTLSGVCENGVNVYKGVPYAQPPVGALRLRRPQEPASWEGILACDTFPAVAPQTKGWVGGNALEKEHQSEDCLYLNIWSTAESAEEKLPVLVWFHGGGFMGGIAHEAVFNGEAFAKQGIVFVSVAVRLGFLGYYASKDLDQETAEQVSGNYGILDAIQALKWIQENIAAFGGDPNSVTIQGQSAGGMTVCTLLASPLAKGLFHKAIIESGLGGGRISASGLEEYEAFCEETLSKKISDTGIETVRSIPADTIAHEIAEHFGYRPIVDGYVLTDAQSVCMLNGNYNQVPLLVGTNAEEQLNKEMRDEIYAIDFLRKNAQITDQPAYLYYFGQKGSCEGGLRMPASHSMELNYVFGTLPSRDTFTTPEGEVVNIINTEEDLEISAVMNRYWGNFAKTGDPNGEGLPTWLKVRDGGRMYFAEGKAQPEEI